MTMEIKKIQTKSVSGEVYKQFIDAIRKGDWKEYEKLPSENELIEMFGVSRVSIRSAMDKLRGQGIIETYRGKGSFISKEALNILNNNFNIKINVSKDEYMDVIQFRRAIELTAVELACEKAKDTDLLNIKKCLDEMSLNTNNYLAFTEADLNFHNNIIIASGNKIFINIFKQNRNLFKEYLLSQNLLGEKNFVFSVKNHNDIYEAITNRNSDKAKELILGSFERNIKRLFK